MARRGNKAIRATVSMKIALSEPLLALINNYVKALRFTLFWLKENIPNPNERGVLGRVHEALYEELREEYNLPSKVAEDCYRDALSVYKGWYNTPKKGRFPRVYKPTVWLTPKASYNVDFEAMTVRITSVGELPILGYPRVSSNVKIFAFLSQKDVTKMGTKMVSEKSSRTRAVRLIVSLHSNYFILMIYGKLNFEGTPPFKKSKL